MKKYGVYLNSNNLHLTRFFNRLPNAEMSKFLLEDIANIQVDLRPRYVDRPIALYGAGDLGQMAYTYFTQINIKIEFVVDADADRLRTLDYWRDVHLHKPEQISEVDKKEMLLAVCIATTSYTQIERKLAAAGWTDIVPFYDIAEAYRDLYPLSNGWIASEFTLGDINKIKNVLSTWSDDLSRAHHLQFIAWRRLRAEWQFQGAPITLYNRYFIPEVINCLTKSENYADIGSHVGKSIDMFLEFAGGACEKIWAVEPDKNSLESLRNNIADLDQYISLEILPLVIADFDGFASFAEGFGYASQLSKISTQYKKVTTIDLLEINPSFIKVHTEGFELEALKGGYKTIEKYRPIIAVTAYHNKLGLWRMPHWIMRNLRNYNFYFRLHSWVGTGAVIYAIPHERIFKGVV